MNMGPCLRDITWSPNGSREGLTYTISTSAGSMVSGCSESSPLQKTKDYANIGEKKIYIQLCVHRAP